MNKLKKRIQNSLSKLAPTWRQKKELRWQKRKGRPGNKLPLRFYFRHFYVTLKGTVGAGVKDFYGNIYQVQRDGSIRRISARGFHQRGARLRNERHQTL